MYQNNTILMEWLFGSLAIGTGWVTIPAARELATWAFVIWSVVSLARVLYNIYFNNGTQ